MRDQARLSSFFIAVLVLCTGNQPQPCHSLHLGRLGHRMLNSVFRTKPNWWNLHFAAGDIIHCSMITPARYHVMLATSSSTIAHMMGDISSGKGTLREESWSDFHGWASPQMEHCWIHSQATLPHAVERAKSDIQFHGNQNIYYNFFMCNGEHWVRYWAHGEAYSRQSRRGTNSKCDVGLERTNVTVYQNPGPGGNPVGSNEKMVVNLVERKCHSWPSPWNNEISKIVLGDLCVRVWDDMECHGQNICFCENEDDLSWRLKAPGSSWDNEISSMSLCNYEEGIETVALLFEHRNYEGAGRKMILQRNECVSYFENDWWNDRVTSVKVTYGCLEFFTDFNCSGSSYKLSGNEDYVGKKYDDQISSIRPC